MKTQIPAFEIVTRDLDSTDERDWTADGIGYPNRFDTQAEALEAIEQLQALGRVWADCAYNIREIEE